MILKRKKSEVNIELPPLIQETVNVEWQSKEEKELAQEIHADLKFSNITETKYKLGNNFGGTVLPKLLRARQVCIYPKLLEEKVSDIMSDDKEDVNNVLKMSMKASSKIDSVIDKIISNKDNGNRKIIFCHFKKEIDILRENLEKYNINVKTFDGRIKNTEREDILNDRSIEILIIQIQTGCEGLNLQHFNEIYFVSPHWNPAVEDQALARCHRIGQEKTIHVYKFQMDTFDKEKLNLCIDKHAKNIQDSKREEMKIINN